MNIPVIFIDDDKAIRDALGQTLELEDYDVQLFPGAKPALDVLDSQFQGVIITDINMPVINGLTFLKQALAIDPEFSIIMLTGHGDISMAVESMRIGAYDFLEKPFSTEHLLDVVKRAADKRQLVLENRELRRELEVQSGPGPRLLGTSPMIRQLRRVLSHLAQNPTPLFIHGQHGTGKSLVARFTHDHSNRQHSPFITVNCQTEHPHQLHHELFGLTDDESDPLSGTAAASAFHRASGGTLYLKHIEQIPSALQLPLLTAIREAKAPESPRIIVSAALDNQQLQHASPFVKALYYELGFVGIALPPLHQRREDIVMLFKNFLRTDCSRFGIEPPQVDNELEHELTQYNWPGNIRELRTFAERYALMGKQASLGVNGDITAASHSQQVPTLADRVADFECKLLCDALHRHQGRLKDVQSELGLARKTLYDKLKKYEINKDEFKVS
ncbi:sigma-54-dependent transcriptional regulator [Photobacterium sp. GSS17]|uniref:sigma-54-dependent transcriptional regulator n=1 Tax=Photobacterium sp. GSS17 TaxID=3020715 RepID=UPI00235EAAC4|nr:sigma-54 dependent transcriptional regulator [Photobacterium sp. GSS17]